MGRTISGLKRYKIRVRGIVQGVGFRPFIYRLAKEHNLTGYVLNDSEGVLIEAQGEQLEQFLKGIKLLAPPASFVSDIDVKNLPLSGEEIDFIIKASPKAVERETLISPDLAICDDCRREINDKNNRRYRYAFTNCTNCGPRFSIVQDVPYDRKNTTMKDFIMCDECLAEYENPLNRRFHAQPNACEICGPHYRLFGETEIICDDVIAKAHDLIKQGAIVAVKGIGGYHLACDAFNSEAVAKLRQRKIREDKPFAVMATNMETIKKLCKVNDEEEKMLKSSSAPIVLLKKSEQYNLAEKVAPHNAYLGVMLAYAPIHCLLLNDDDVFVMTSANLSDEPIVYRDEEVFSHLKEIADYKLVHNRLINTRVDDSVVRIFKDKPILIRRSRGFAPAPINLGSLKCKEISVLACGPELKNTFCLTKNDKAFLSQHIGDLENMAVNNAYKESIALFKKLFDISPNLIACDMHPEYFSTKYAKQLNLPCVQVQHHHAHIASVLAEHDFNEKVIGVALDGTGYGDDGNIWGGEFMVADLLSYKRVGHFAYMPLPGGAKAVKEPWRLALYQAYDIYGDEIAEKYPELLKPNWRLLIQAAKNGLNAPLSSGAGRVFDTVSALLGICHKINYEGQAAIELERAAYDSDGEILPFDICMDDGQYILNLRQTYKSLYDLKLNKGLRYSAKSFHLTLAQAIGDIIDKIGIDTGIKTVVFSGGVCLNMTLMELLYNRLSHDFNLYMNEKVPVNDGGISLGQATVALKRYKNDLVDLNV